MSSKDYLSKHLPEAMQRALDHAVRQNFPSPNHSEKVKMGVGDILLGIGIVILITFLAIKLNLN